MKQFIIKLTLSVALYMTATVAAIAQEPSKVKATVNELVKKYENVKGVECTTFLKGEGLGMVKMMLNKQFGRDFMKGVTSITFIDHSDASEETSLELRKELDVFTSLLEELKPEDEKETATEGYTRSFASISKSDKTISDFVIAIEDKDSKVIMYMAGKIQVE